MKQKNDLKENEDDLITSINVSLENVPNKIDSHQAGTCFTIANVEFQNKEMCQEIVNCDGNENCGTNLERSLFANDTFLEINILNDNSINNNCYTRNNIISGEESSMSKVNLLYSPPSEDASQDISYATESSNNISNNCKSDYSFNPSEITHSDEQGTSLEISKVIDKSSSFDNSFSVDIQKLTVLNSIPEKGKTKKHFCMYCKKLQTKFARHLELKHKEEADVKKFIFLPPGPERKSIIESIRKKGDFIHNTKPKYNTGILIVPRQKQRKSVNMAEDYVCCKFCKGFFSQRTIRLHVGKCDPTRKKGARNILSAGRRTAGFIHPSANTTLRRIVFPVMRDDIVVRCIKYDELIIKYGNKLCEKYTLSHQHDLIRAELRLLGRFKLELISIDSDIKDLKDVFQPRKFDAAIASLRKVAEWDEKIGWFTHPATAQHITTLVKKCARKLRSECIKCEDEEKKRKVDDFLLLWEEEVPSLINKRALEDLMSQKRKKKIILPSKQDIKLLYSYLKRECNTCMEILKHGFDIHAWTLLSQSTLVLIQIFNRRRAGEIERLTQANYETKQVLSENVDPEIYAKLSESTKKVSGQFLRLKLRGKLGRDVSVLLSPIVVEYIENILKFRKEAGVSVDNEYIFCIPHRNSLSKKYRRACPLLRRFANECGALMPSSLRGTILRKHIATYTAMLDVEESLVEHLANFMGHHKDIHKTIYRIPVPVAEITDVSQLLMAAIGDDENKNNEYSTNNDEENESSDDQNSDDTIDEDNSPLDASNKNTLINIVDDANSLYENISPILKRRSSKLPIIITFVQ